MNSGTFQLFVKNLHGKTISLMAQYQQTVRALKKQAIAYDGSLQYASWLYAGKKLEDDRTLSDYGIGPESCIHCVIRLAGGGPEPLMMDDNQLESELLMGIASGGTISQKVYKDSFSADEYDEEAVQRLWIHTVSSAAWETITGVVAPMSPIVPGTYEKYDYPWYRLYDENSQAISMTGGFTGLQSVFTIDSSRVRQRRPAFTSLDPNAPPRCSHHGESNAVCVFRPCSHNACTSCLGAAMMKNSECPVCCCVIAKFVGFKAPIVKVHAGCGSEEGWTVEQGIVGVLVADGYAENVITLFLDEDRVHCPTSAN